MNQKYEIWVLLVTLSSACLALPTKSESNLKFETLEAENITESNKIQIIPKTTENLAIKLEAEEISFRGHNSSKPEELADHNNESSKNLKITGTNEDSLLGLNDLNIEDFKDVDSERYQQQSDVRKDFDNAFLPLEHRLPDLTDEEYGEINKEGATPWNFLKTLEDTENHPKENKPDSMQNLTPIYINIPIVINGHTSLPLSLAIGGQNIALKLTSSPAVRTPSVYYDKLKDNNSTLLRQTNRHRSNFHTNINALNNNQQTDVFLYKN